MKKASLLFGMALLGFTLPARADLTHKLTSSVQLQVDAGYTQVSRTANSYSTSGSGVSTTVTPSGGSAASSLGGITAVSNAGVATFTLPDAAQTTQGNSYSYTQNITTGDAIVTTAADVGDVNGYSNTVSTAPGSAGSLAGTLATSGAIGLTAGGAGTSATGQFVTEITIR
tara:strand:+ start:750 stop:1262 length:513 start_codon:yes stop_codon:yes gene_type:complete